MRCGQGLSGARRLATVAVVLALLALPTGWPPALFAQEGEGAELTLDEALEIARRHNPAMRRAMNDLDLNAPSVRASWGSFLPTLSLNLGTSASFRRETFGVDNLGRPIENPQPEWVTTSSSSQSISSSVTLFDGGRRRNQLRVEQARARTRSAGVEGELITLRAGVERAFLGAVQQRMLLGVEEELLDNRIRELESTRRLFQVAVRDQVDVLGAELAVQQQERQVELVSGEFRKAILTLRSQLGDRDLPAFTVPLQEPGVFDPSSLDVEELVQRALASSPRVVEQELAVTTARASLSATRAQLRIPTLSVSGNFGRSDGQRNWGGFLDPNPNGSRGGGMSVGFSIPGFGGFNSFSQIAQSDVALRNAVETERQVRLQVEEEIRARLIDLERAWRSLDLARRSLVVAERRLELTREKYQLATATFEELSTAAEQAAEQRRNVTNEQFNFATARIALEEAAGVLVVGGES
jgi:outer membrane protein